MMRNFCRAWGIINSKFRAKTKVVHQKKPLYPTYNTGPKLHPDDEKLLQSMGSFNQHNQHQQIAPEASQQNQFVSQKHSILHLRSRKSRGFSRRSVSSPKIL